MRTVGVTDYTNQTPPMHFEWKLEDLKVLRRSPDLYYYVEIGQGQLQLIKKHILF